MSMSPVVLVLGPSRAALSGVSTHLNLLLGSPLADNFHFSHFQVGSEGRHESRLRRLARLLFSPLALALRIQQSGAALVHINTSLNPRAYWRDLVYLLVAKLCGVRVVYQVHGGDLPGQFRAGLLLGEDVLRWVLGLPDAIVVLAQVELAAYRAFVPEQQVLAIPNAIPLAGRTRPPAPPERPLRLVYVGRLAWEKGLGEALEGLARARSRGCDASLAIAGDGPDREAITAEARELGLCDGELPAVRFLPPVFGADKEALFAASDALLLPTYAEGLPYALLEAMAVGLPPVTTRVGGIPDVVAEGVHGLFVPPRDSEAVAHAILQLAGDRDRLERMGVACRRRIEHAYGIGRLAAEFGQLYTGLCATDACPRRSVGLLGKP